MSTLKILVFQDIEELIDGSYITELQQKATLMANDKTPGSISGGLEEQSNSIYLITGQTSNDCADPSNTEFALDNENISQQDDAASQETENPETGLFNPLTTGPPTFMSPGDGRICRSDRQLYSPWLT